MTHTATAAAIRGHRLRALVHLSEHLARRVSRRRPVPSSSLEHSPAPSRQGPGRRTARRAAGWVRWTS
ncbi:hypothetical protein [Blastococcus mobilis]|uniref:hypothetical protein n=1 Tax=Blastococcus mobilis TaxID=1938746 RepID=UPI0011320BFC|nr:hypothetical protein [Blastococcus mobilis]